MKYAIMVNCYEVNPNDENDIDYTVPLYLGLNKDKLFIFEEDVTDRTKVFDSAAEAGEYIDKHDTLNGNKQRSWGKNVRIVEVGKDER